MEPVTGRNSYETTKNGNIPMLYSNITNIDSATNLKWDNTSKSHIMIMNQTPGAKNVDEQTAFTFGTLPSGITQLVGVVATSFGNNNPAVISCAVTGGNTFTAKFHTGLSAGNVVQFIGFFV